MVRGRSSKLRVEDSSIVVVIHFDILCDNVVNNSIVKYLVFFLVFLVLPNILIITRSICVTRISYMCVCVFLLMRIPLFVYVCARHSNEAVYITI